MSSKKQLRRKRQQQKAAKRQRFNPATAFILLVLALVLAIGVTAAILGGGDRPPAPWPGAVWSAEHGHWH